MAIAIFSTYFLFTANGDSYFPLNKNTSIAFSLGLLIILLGHKIIERILRVKRAEVMNKAPNIFGSYNKVKAILLNILLPILITYFQLSLIWTH